MKTAIKNKILSDVAQIIPGAAQGSTYIPDIIAPSETAYLLKGSNLDSEGGITIDDMSQVSLGAAQNAERHILQEGDAVVMARGSAIRAGYVSKEVAVMKIIASANFIIIRPNPTEIRGEVIVAFLGSIVGSQRLQSLSKGAAIQHIPASSLRELQIPVPDMRTQQIISDIFHANRNAYQSTLALAEQQKETGNAAMLNLMLEVA